MRGWAKSIVAAGLVVLGTTAAAAADLESLRPFLEEHCTSCHGAEKQKGEYRFDTLGSDLGNVEELEVWQNILDQINLGEMPPADEPQPARGQAEGFVDALTGELARAYEEVRGSGGEAVLRRLNRHELRNTFRDLLHLDGYAYRPAQSGSRLTDNNGNGSVERESDDPLRLFPEDEGEDGFVNLGDKLVMSDFLLDLMLGAAEETLATATQLGPRPDTRPLVFEGQIRTGGGNGQTPIDTAAREVHKDFCMILQGYERFGRITPTDLRGGVGFGARYRITVEASAHNADHPWGELAPTRPAEPFQLCLNIAHTRQGGIEGPTSTPLALWDIPTDGRRRSFTHEVWIDAGWTTWVGWENGPMQREFRAETIVERHYPDAFFPRPHPDGDKEAHDRWPLDMARVLLAEGYPGPHIRLHRITLEPVVEEWPPRSHTALYGSGEGRPEEVRDLLHRFAERAFRRQVDREEIEPYAGLVLSSLEEPDVQSLGGITDLRYRYFEGKWSQLPSFDEMDPTSAGELPGGLIDLGVRARDDFYGLVFEGEIEVPEAGEYAFEMASDDGARITVGGEEILEHDGLHGAELKRATVALEPGGHDIRIDYLAYGVPNSFRAAWSGAGLDLTPLSVGAAPSRPNNAQPEEGRAPKVIRALQDGYIAILCSPQFLYLQEDDGELDDYAIASRLSYFLWSSMPDDELLSLARSGQLGDPVVRHAQVERMLADPRAAAFTHHFPGAWLRLDKLGSMPPSGNDFAFYRNLKVEPMLRGQVSRYFGDILDANLPIDRFIDADYTYTNKVLAKWIYRDEDADIRGLRLRKVPLDDPRRGGIFTLPGVMTATANGVDTSPVIRGTWVLENVLGTPPPPPPPDVEPLPTDTRDATTIRDLLALHRQHDACGSCHRKIDPMGFAFENFDPVGRWRDKYPRARDPIDASATLSTGREIADIVEFKAVLKERRELIVRSLATKMLTYACGRQMGSTDRGEIDLLLAGLSEGGDRLRDLVHAVVESELFLTK